MVGMQPVCENGSIPNWLGHSSYTLTYGRLIQRLDWALVRSFLAVLDAGSVSAAARATQGHQPTFSRHLAELEAQLGVALFERTGRGVRPTAAGLRRCRPRARCRPPPSRSRAASRAGARPPAARCASPPARSSPRGCCRRWWRVPARRAGDRHRAGGSNAVQNLLRREADIAIRMVRPDQGSLIARKVGEITLGAYAGADYLAAMARRARRRSCGPPPGGLRQGRDHPARHRPPRPRTHPPDFAARTDDQVVNAQLSWPAPVSASPPITPPPWAPRHRVLPDLPCRPCRAGSRCTASCAPTAWSSASTTSWPSHPALCIGRLRPQPRRPPRSRPAC